MLLPAEARAVLDWGGDAERVRALELASEPNRTPAELWALHTAAELWREPIRPLTTAERAKLWAEHGSPFAGIPVISDKERQERRANREQRRAQRKGKEPELVVLRPARGPVRPDFVYAVRAKDHKPWNERDRVGVVVAPDDLAKGPMAVLEILCHEGTLRLVVGSHSTEFALHKLGAGRYWLADKLAEHDIHVDPTTARNWLKELQRRRLVKLNGRLRDFWGTNEHGERIKCSGANVYALAVSIGKHGKAAFNALTDHTRGSAPLIGLFMEARCLFVGTQGRRRVQAALKWAVENAQEGVRNEYGRWLSWRCKKHRLTHGEAERVMKDYRKGVSSLGHPYTSGEVKATLRHAYSGRARMPSN